MTALPLTLTSKLWYVGCWGRVIIPDFWTRDGEHGCPGIDSCNTSNERRASASETFPPTKASMNLLSNNVWEKASKSANWISSSAAASCDGEQYFSYMISDNLSLACRIGESLVAFWYDRKRDSLKMANSVGVNFGERRWVRRD